ncbi:hypothetical protein [Croceicoccus gelatinilyticus]|uniref:hypothetical protein n=1 Tax=Croceicoccus gelatinilyticus TaxID=2835536 RepID=UPI001BCFFD92|nr:hypothetical protein [Croceicoccus gelatinilyticus]MBS7670729.1 hypothetical protein [Croceicoccus gelatinilyticus]
MRQSRKFVDMLEANLFRVTVGWLAIVGVLTVLRLSDPAAAINVLGDAWAMIIGYAIIAVAPVLGYLVGVGAAKALGRGFRVRHRFAIVGNWHRVDPEHARLRPEFGPYGFLASLVFGLLLNVAIRTFEFFTAVPAMSANAPLWAQTMFGVMAVDLVVTSFFYMTSLAFALRLNPLFPRMLFLAWAIDIYMQLFLARRLTIVGGLPEMLHQPIRDLLDGNVTKVLIGSVIWLPYLLLSRRVNLTYRLRIPAPREG